jgi:TonB family protein
LRKALGSDLDRLALAIVGQERFRPSTHDGSPVAVSQSIEVKLEGCFYSPAQKSGSEHLKIRLASTPIQAFSALPDAPAEVALTPSSGSFGSFSRVSTQHGHLKPPSLIHSEAAAYPPQARQEKTSGDCMVNLIVDAQGLPQAIELKAGLDPSLSQSALAAVQLYRFSPGTEDDRPVPMKITVQVSFRLY